MIRAVEFESASLLASPDRDELIGHMDQILQSKSKGLVVRDVSLKTVSAVARDLGLTGDTRMSVPFVHKNKLDEALQRLDDGLSLDGTWRDYGVTQLHADGDEGDEMISAAHMQRGEVAICVFDRGERIKEVSAIDLFDTLEEETQRILTTNTVDTEMLSHQAVCLRAGAGDIIVFGPSNPHMAITLSTPRHSESTFFQR